MNAFATSYAQPDTLSLYNVVLFIHIAAAMLAFGVTFAYPIVDAILHRPGNLRHLAWWHSAQVEIGRKLINVAGTVLLLAGIYLAAAGPFHFSQAFVSVGMVVIVILLGLGGAFFMPTERKAAELAARDIEASGDGEVVLSAEYEALAKRLQVGGASAGALVLVTVLLMVLKPA